MSFKSFIVIVSAMCALAGMCFSQTEETTPMPSSSNTNQSKNPVFIIRTNKGYFKVELNSEKAPVSVQNFSDYVNNKYYDNTIFHRIINGFMIQGGGFTVDFKQKPTSAPIKNEADNGLKNVRGTIAMARTSDPDSATSQFFINTANNDFLDFKSPTPTGWGYAVFGKVIAGMDVVDKIQTVKTGNYGAHQNVPLDPVVIESITEVKE